MPLIETRSGPICGAQAMNLVAKCLEGLDPPESLPQSLQKPGAAPTHG